MQSHDYQSLFAIEANQAIIIYAQHQPNFPAPVAFTEPLRAWSMRFTVHCDKEPMSSLPRKSDDSSGGRSMKPMDGLKLHHDDDDDEDDAGDESSTEPAGPPTAEFPSFWFGENADAMDNATELALVGKFSLAIYGWQHALGVAPKGRQEGQKLSAQCAALKATGSRARCAVYRQGWLAMSNYDEQRVVLDAKASATAGWWLTDDTGAPDGHSGTPSGVPVSSTFWNFANASAAEYYQQKVVRPLTQDLNINGVFFDDMPGACCNSEHNLPSHYTKHEALAICDATLANFRAVAQILNAGGKLPIFSMFQKPWQPCLYPQSTILSKLGSDIHYARFSQTVLVHEGIPTSYGANCSQSIEAALAEVAYGLDYIQYEDVSTGAYKRDEQLNLSTAVFLLVRSSASNQSYYGSSSSWSESGWQWVRWPSNNRFSLPTVPWTH